MSKATLNYKGYTGSYDVSFEDECLHGKILFIDDLISYEGETPKQLESEFKAAVDRYQAYCKKTGNPANKPYSGTFNVRIGPELHRRAAQAAYAQGIGLNDYVDKSIQAQLDKATTTKIEHVHNHYVILKTESIPETRIATGARPASWELLNATKH